MVKKMAFFHFGINKFDKYLQVFLHHNLLHLRPFTSSRLSVYVQPTQPQPAADSFSTLCQRCELSRKAMSSWWVGRQQGALCSSSPGAGWGSIPLSCRLVSVRSWLERAWGHVPLQYLNKTVSSES